MISYISMSPSSSTSSSYSSSPSSSTLSNTQQQFPREFVSAPVSSSSISNKDKKEIRIAAMSAAAANASASAAISLPGTQYAHRNREVLYASFLQHRSFEIEQFLSRTESAGVAVADARQPAKVDHRPTTTAGDERVDMIR